MQSRITIKNKRESKNKTTTKTKQGMKINKFFMGMLGALALASCSSEEGMLPDEPNVTPGDGDARFMSVTIRNTGGSTRATGDYEDGNAYENDVKSMVFYFFDKDGNAINVVNGDKNYFTYEPENKDISGENSSENIEKIVNATIVLQSPKGDNIENLHSMVAVLNYDGFLSVEKNMNLSDLEKECKNYASKLINNTNDAVPNGYTDESTDIPTMVMTSATYLADGKSTFKVSGVSAYVKDDPDEAKADPVDIYVERLVAKVTLDVELAKSVTYNDITIEMEQDKNKTAIKLKDSKGNDIKIGNDDVYVKFEGWGLQGTAQQSYLFKRVGNWNLSGWGNGFGWNNPGYNRSHWALNPTSVTPVTLKHFKYSDANGKISETFFYCLENAADDAENGTKTVYDPTSGITNRTQAFIKAKLGIFSDGVFKEVSLAEWGGVKYTEDGAKKQMVSSINNDIYLRTAEPISTETITKEDNSTETIKTYGYISLPEDMVKFVSGMESGLWDDDVENDKRYLSYIMLKKLEDTDFTITDAEGNKIKYEKAFYKDMHGTRYSGSETETPSFDADCAAVNKKLLNVAGARLWEDGKTYYYSDIEHLNQDPKATEATGKIGVVRNHVYKVKITSVVGLGTPVINKSDGTEEIIIPQRPGNDEFYLGARVNILSWRIVPNDIDLKW